MGFGSTAKKVQKLADVAEKTYSRLNELREQVTELRETVETTGDRVAALEGQVATQRAIIDAIAEANDVDVEQVLEAADIEADTEPAETAGDGAAESAEDPNAAS